MPLKKITHLHDIVHGLNQIGKYFNMPTFKLGDFNLEGFSGYMFPNETPSDTSLFLNSEDQVPSGTLDIRYWGQWETDPECDWDTEDDDWEVLSSESAETMNAIVQKSL